MHEVRSTTVHHTLNPIPFFMSHPSVSKSIEIELMQLANPERAQFVSRFFKTQKGEYGEGDRFLGINVPITRSIVKRYQNTATIEDAETLLNSKWHECRLAGAVLLNHFFKTGTDADRRIVYSLYIKHHGLNNWDLIDISAPNIIGTHLINKSISPLRTLAKSKNLWKRRIAIVSTLAMIREKKLNPTFEISEILMNDKHDLIHKACGWMLREAGKRDKKALEIFLRKHLSIMPRTMLRYAIEKFPEGERKGYLKRGSGYSVQGTKME
jgi:3-methyladenine DNA glycosylase AlkD